MEIRIPELCLVVLVGVSSSGKSTFVRKHFLPTEIISSDQCRGFVSDDENSLEATGDAFDLLHYMATKRLKRGKLTVIDATSLRKEDRAKLLNLAKENYCLAIAILMDTPEKIIIERHTHRTDRDFGKHVLFNQLQDFRKSARSIKEEGFNKHYFLKPEEEVTFVREKLWNDKKEVSGPFDIIGDIHGCFDELCELLNSLSYEILFFEGKYNVSHPQGRQVIFLGDLTDRGPKSAEVLRLVMDMLTDKKAYCVLGNHDLKLLRYLRGANVSLKHGLEETAAQLANISEEFKQEIIAFLGSLISHYVLDEGRLVVAHAGIREEMQGRASGVVRAFCLYGETSGEIDEFGLPVRYNWAANYRGKAMVVYGHTPIPSPEWLNNTINIDTGCVFGGKLTALRYPEKRILQIEAQKTYAEPIRPLLPLDTEMHSAQQLFDDVLEVETVDGKRYIENRYGPSIVIREENAIAALEVMSRFAVNPKWLIYLPPTMSPTETSPLPEYLEHPAEAFQYYKKNGISKVVCEEKHMGSRAVVIVCKTPEVAQSRFGMKLLSLGTCYTRTGRSFFANDTENEQAFLQIIQTALTKADFWEKFQTDWVCLDCELMPWSAKAQALLVNQYAAVGSSGKQSMQEAMNLLQIAQERGLPIEGLMENTGKRQKALTDYIEAYRRYCRPSDGVKGLVLAPFHILATEGHIHTDKNHEWHMNHIADFCQYDREYLLATPYKIVSLEDTEQVDRAIDWWKALTEKGGEGMVVKPYDYIASTNKGMLQPAIKCRGQEYLRIIYGPEYTLFNNTQKLKTRNISHKRNLAVKEFKLGLEALARFVEKEPLRRVHECVFGVLAMESEETDPRL